jgi:hypothetical protein
VFLCFKQLFYDQFLKEKKEVAVGNGWNISKDNKSITVCQSSSITVDTSTAVTTSIVII